MTILSAWTALQLVPIAQVAQAAIGRDTVLLRQLPPVRTGMEELFFLASGMTSVLAVILLGAVLLTMYRLRRAAASAGERFDTLMDELRPMLQQAVEASESVRKTADLLHDEVTTVHEGVQETTQRVKQTVGDLADRMDDFNDLLGKVHSRADAVVTVAGSAVDGLAWGARKLRERREEKRERAQEKLDRQDKPEKPHKRLVKKR